MLFRPAARRIHGVLAILLIAGGVITCRRDGRDEFGPPPPSAAPAAAPASAHAPPHGAAPHAASKPAADPWNIVLITIDALRADHLGCYGYPRSTSPNMDRLAAKGIVFEQAAAQWPKTGPSMASLLTSTYGSTSGVLRTTLDKKIPSSYDLLPEILHAGGYQAFGVVANMSLSAKFNFDQGFDRERFLAENKNTYADHVSAIAKGLVETRDKSKPYFMWVHYLDPHAPYAKHPDFGKEFVGDATWRADERPPVPVDPRVKDPKAPVKEGNEIGQIPAYAYMAGKQQIRDYVAQYDGNIRCLDQHLGALLDWMRAQGALEHTIVIVTADHGESLGDHNYFFEHGRFPYDDCVRVPLIIFHPDWKAARVAAPVGLIDLAPTLLELVGLAPGWQFQGHSLLGWLRGGATGDPPGPVFSQSGYLKEYETSIRKGRYKLIHVGSRYMAGFLTGKAYELYDVVADPGETKNLVDEKPELLEELRAELDPFMEMERARVPPPQDGEAFAPTAEEQKVIDALGYGNEKERAKQGDEEHEHKGGGGG